jgi:hypothetical protein
MPKKKATGKKAPKAKRPQINTLIPKATLMNASQDPAEPDDGPIIPLPGKKLGSGSSSR